jgi:uncharacterized membrane protein
MTGKGLRTWTAVIATALAIVIAWSITANNYIVPLVAVVLAVGLTYVLRRRTKEVTKDERTALLYQKAAVATISICVPIIALVGIILFALRGRLSADMAAVGYVLAYVACGLLLVQSALYSYYGRKN